MYSYFLFVKLKCILNDSEEPKKQQFFNKFHPSVILLIFSFDCRILQERIRSKLLTSFRYVGSFIFLILRWNRSNCVIRIDTNGIINHHCLCSSQLYCNILGNESDFLCQTKWEFHIYRVIHKDQNNRPKNQNLTYCL